MEAVEVLRPKCPECGGGPTGELRSLPEHYNTWKRIFRCFHCGIEFEGELITPNDCRWRECYLGAMVAHFVEVGTVQGNCIGMQKDAFGYWHCPQGEVQQPEGAYIRGRDDKPDPDGGA